MTRPPLAPHSAAGYPAVIVHGAEDVRTSLCAGRPVTLLSAGGAALYAGAGWWRALIALGRSEFPAASFTDILDCADATGRAFGAMRIGQAMLVLAADAPGFAAAASVAEQLGCTILTLPPPALDLAQRGAARRLVAWLDSADHIDSGSALR